MCTSVGRQKAEIWAAKQEVQDGGCWHGGICSSNTEELEAVGGERQPRMKLCWSVAAETKIASCKDEAERLAVEISTP